MHGGREGKRPLGGPRHRCKDDIKLDFKLIGWKDVGLAVTLDSYVGDAQSSV
jgi:hypothetical protein